MSWRITGELGGRGFKPGRAHFFWRKKISIFFQKNIFPGVFKWFRLHKKVSLTTLGPSGMPGGATHGPSQAPHGLQNCQNGQNRQKMAKNGPKSPKNDFF